MADRDPTIASPAASWPDAVAELTTAPTTEEVLHLLRTSTTIALAHAQLLQKRWWCGALDQDQFERGVDGIVEACHRLIVLSERIERSEPG